MRSHQPRHVLEDRDEQVDQKDVGHQQVARHNGRGQPGARDAGREPLAFLIILIIPTGSCKKKKKKKKVYLSVLAFPRNEKNNRRYSSISYSMSYFFSNMIFFLWKLSIHTKKTRNSFLNSEVVVLNLSCL